MFRTRFCLLQRVLLIMMVCLAVTPALGKGKPQPPSEPPTPPTPPPVKYDISWFNTDGAYDRFRIHNVDGPGTTMVGSMRMAGAGVDTAVKIVGGDVVDLNTMPGIPANWQLTSARGITAGGIIAGEMANVLDQQQGLFVYDLAASNPFQVIGAVPITPGLQGTMHYRDMNENGDVLYAEFFTSNSYLYTHDNQTIHNLPESLMLAEEYGKVGPNSINNDRVIAGNLDGFHYDTAYVFDFANDTVTKIPQFFRALDINNSGVIAGGGTLSTKGKLLVKAIHYASSDGGKTLPDDKTTNCVNFCSEAGAINEAGQSAGTIWIKDREVPDTGYIYDPTDGFWSLDDLLVDDTPEDLAYWYSGSSGLPGSVQIEGISEAPSEESADEDGNPVIVYGYPTIVGSKYFPGDMFDDGVDRYAAFILTPEDGAAATAAIPEPASIALLCFGTLVVIGRRQFRTMAQHRLASMLTGMFIISSATAFAQPFTLSRTFDDPTPTDWDYFGQSVALDGDRILIGSPFDDTNGANVGQAHLFDATTGELLVTFDNPTPYPVPDFGQSEGFGSLKSVALDGNRVLISARYDDTNGNDVGQAYLFDTETGSLLHTFNDPTVTQGDGFGVSVALDGNHVLIGAYRDDTNGENVGQAHLFDAETGSLLYTFNDPTGTQGDRFGTSVALDGNHVLISAPPDDRTGENVDQAHLFDATTGDLLQTFEDPTPSSVRYFGGTMALDGNHVLIGAYLDDTNGEFVGQAHLFDATTGDLLLTFDDPTPSTNPGYNVGDQFGSSLAIDGNLVLIGAPGDDTNGVNVGQAHLFDVTTGELLQTLDDPNPTSVPVDPGCCFVGDRFGVSVALDGSRVLIGARQDDTNGENVGQAHLFTAVSEPSADFDDSGMVGNNDLTLLLDGWGGAPGAGWTNNPPTTVGNDSLTLLLDDWGQPFQPGAIGVPEPSCLAIALLATMSGLAVRRCPWRCRL